MGGDHSIHVDARWIGDFGLGRYSAEVLSRLPDDWHRLRSSWSPSGPLDTVNPARLALPASVLLYSPGFGGGWARCRQLLTLHDLIHFDGSGVKAQVQRAYYERVLRPVVRRTGHVLTVSPSSAASLEGWLEDDDVTVHDVGNGCSEVFTTAGAGIQALRPYFLFVGNHKPHKNLGVVLAAMRGVSWADLVVITPDRVATMEKASEMGVELRVQALAGVSDQVLASYYRGARALVFPSTIEGFGLPVVEAAKSGCPTIYFNGCTSVTEICGSAGLVVASASDPGAWAAAMNSLEGDLMLALPDVSMYDWDQVAKRVTKTVQLVARDGG